MIGLESYSRQVFYIFGPHFDLYQSLNRLPIWNSQNCSMFPLAFVTGWLQGHFISRNYVVWPIFFLMNVFIALKWSHFWFLFTFTAADGVQRGGRKMSPRTSTIVQFIFMSPTEGEGGVLYLVRILLASALALASASSWHFLVCTISHEPMGRF